MKPIKRFIVLLMLIIGMLLSPLEFLIVCTLFIFKGRKLELFILANWAMDEIQGLQSKQK